MDPALYFGIYGEGVEQNIILRHTKYIKSKHLPRLIKNYIWGD